MLGHGQSIIHQWEHGPKPFCSTFHWLILGKFIMELLVIFESSRRNPNDAIWQSVLAILVLRHLAWAVWGTGLLQHSEKFWWSTASWCSRSSRARIWAACAVSIRTWTCYARVTQPYTIYTCKTMGWYEETCICLSFRTFDKPIISIFMWERFKYEYVPEFGPQTCKIGCDKIMSWPTLRHTWLLIQ
jgi:hypothetical protein